MTARTLVRMQFGSHVYGTNVPTSDLDFKAHGYVYITTNLVNGKRYIGMKKLRSRVQDRRLVSG